MKKFIKIIDHYVNHILDSNNTSLIVRVYGLFKIKAASFQSANIILMENLNYDRKDESIKYTFDLKGSIRNRFVFWKPSDKYPFPGKKCLKDVNFNQIVSNKS